MIGRSIDSSAPSALRQSCRSGFNEFRPWSFHGRLRAVAMRMPPEAVEGEPEPDRQRMSRPRIRHAGSRTTRNGPGLTCNVPAVETIPEPEAGFPVSFGLADISTERHRRCARIQCRAFANCQPASERCPTLLHMAAEIGNRALQTVAEFCSLGGFVDGRHDKPEVSGFSIRTAVPEFGSIGMAAIDCRGEHR